MDNNIKRCCLYLIGGGMIPMSMAASANLGPSLGQINAMADMMAYQVNDLVLTSELQRAILTTDSLMEAKYALLSELNDEDGDNTVEPPAFRSGIAGYDSPGAGGFIPVASIAPKVDGYGMPLGYCAWDHGSVRGSAGRVSGQASPDNTALLFAVISSGRSREFNTNCGDVASQSVYGDDQVVRVTLGQANYGVATTQHYGKPVEARSDLFSLDTALTEPGELRLVMEERTLYGWLDDDGSGVYEWSPITDIFSTGSASGNAFANTHYRLGLGERFESTSEIPAAQMEVDGNVIIAPGEGRLTLRGDAHLHLGRQEAPANSSGESARLSIQPFGHTGGPFNFVARDAGPVASLDIRYGDRTSADNIFSLDHRGNAMFGNSLQVVGNEWNILRSRTASRKHIPYSDGLIRFQHLHLITPDGLPATIFSSESTGEGESSDGVIHYSARSVGFHSSKPTVSYLSQNRYGRLNRNVYHFRAQQRYGEPDWVDEAWIRGGGNAFFNGRVGIGTSTPSVKLDVTGSVRATSFDATSDGRLKDDIESVTEGLDTIRRLRGVSYFWDKEFSDDASRHYGFIAQEVKSALPDAVVKDGEGFLSLRYNTFIPVLVEAVKELDSQQSALSSQVSDHADSITELHAVTNDHEARINALEGGKAKSDEVSVSKGKEVIDKDSTPEETNISVSNASVQSTGPLSRFYSR